MFEFKGKQYSLEQLQSVAQQKGYTFDELLNKNPDIIDLGKTTPTSPGADVEGTAAPEIQPTVTESPSVDISLELPQTGTVDSTIKKPKIRTESELKIDATRNAMSIASPVASIMPDFMIPVLADWTAMTAETAAGVADTTEILYEGLLAATTDETFDKIAREQRIDMSNVYEGVEALRNIREKKYDEQGNELDAIGLWESGRKSESAQQFVSEAIGSLPSTVLTYMLPGAGSAIIGAGVLGSEFEKNLKERPDETAGAMLSNAAIKGGSEALFEFLGGYTFKQISKIGGKKLAQKTITELTKDAIPYALGKILGVGAQGISEAATEAATGTAQLYADQLVFGDKIDSSQYWRTAIHSGIVGGLMGGGITAGTVGAQVALTGDRKKAALSIIAPKQWKSEQIQIGREIDQAAKDYQAAPQNKKKFFQNKIEVLEQRQQGRAERLSKTWDGLTRNEKMNYAKLLDEANSQLDIVGNNKYTKKAQDDAQLALNEAYSRMQNILGKDNINADIEQSISKTLKASQSILEQVEKAKTIKNLNIQSVSNETFQEVLKAVTGKKSAADAMFFDGNNIYINKDISAVTEQTNVVGHELLHYLMAKNFDTSNESMQPLVDSFKDYLKETQPEIFERVESRINSLYTNEKTGEIEKGALEEYLNVFSDLIAKEKIVVNETFSDKIKNTTTRFLNGLGFGSIKLETGKDVFNFIRNYNKNISNFKYKQLGIDITSDKISKGLNEEVAKKSISGNNIQKIFDEKGKDGAFDIIEAYKPLTTKLTNKYRDVPGFDFELLQSEIEIGKRGLLDLINAYDPSKGATLNTYIQGQLANRSIEAANRILDTEFKLDVTEAKGVTDTATVEETIEAAEEAEFADEIKSLRKEIGLSEELVSTVKNAVVKTFGTKLPNPQDPKFRLELQKRFRIELKKPLAKFVGKQADYESFLRDNFQSIYNKLPQSLINRRFKDFQEPVLDKNGKHVREKTAEGNKVYTKKKISKAEFIKYFLGSEVGRSTQGTRKTAIVEAVAEEIAFDATMEVLNDPAVIQKYQDIAGITGEVLPENFKSIIAKQVDRAENFKFSKSIANNAKAEYNLESQELGRILDKTSLDKLSDKYSLISDAIIYEADPDNIKFSLTTKADGKWEQNALNPLDESAKLYKFKVGEVDYEINTFKDRYAFNYDIFESTMDIQDEFISNDLKSWAMAFADALDGSTDLTGVATQGLTNQFKVFGTVANATIDLIKKEKLNSITFSGKEKSRKRLYRSLSDKFAKELGWEAYDFEAQLASGAETVFIVYDPKAFPTTTSIKFSLSAKEKNAVNKIINTLQKDLLKNIESENVNFADDLNLFIFNKFNEGVEKNLNLNEILENVIKETNNFITDENSKNLISKAFLNTDGKLNRNYFLGIKQAAGIALKKEIAELGFESSKKLVENRLKNASENERSEIIKNWFINESKAITTFSGLSNITKIQDIYNKVIIKLLEKYNIEGFKTDKNPKGAGQKLFFNNIPINRYKSTTDIKRNFALYISQINKEANDAKAYVLGILDYYKNNNLINEGKAHIKLLANDQIGAVRKIAKAGMYVENLPTKETTLEHQTPVLQITLDSNNFLDGKISREQLEKEFDNAQVNLVTKKVDKALTAANLKSSGKNRMQNDLVKQAVKEDIDSGKKYKNVESVYNDQKLSKSLNKEFNTILEQSSGIEAAKKFSPVEARIAGKGKGKLKLFIPYSADDFVGLLYTTLSGGKAGDQQMNWYRENLLRPFSRGIQQYEAAKQNALREWQILKKEAKKSVPGGLNKKNASGLTNQEAVRLYIWKQQGMEIPGTKGSAAFVNENLKTVRKNPELKSFAERLMALNPEGYPAPSDNWDSGDITTDLVSYIDGVKRGEFLTEFKDNAAKIFSDSNKEKLRALYGDNFIEALEDMLHRMKTGTNRKFGASKIERQFMDWTNNSVGAIMFFNARSAVLQTLSAVNFINFTDNNPINAAIAFGNFPQYVKDFSTLFNSDFLKQRRTGLQTDVNADEIARAAKGAKNTARAMLSAILKFGFTPTQIADSFAIASGGATFYRNRIKKYKKEGLSQQEAETKAFTDFQEIAEETQQSARPDRISLQQASSLGRLILAFGNTPMQYARLTKKASLDLINGRGDWKTNISKIMYYSVIQNIIFSALQQGLFALLFDDEDDDKEKSRLFRIGNSSFDTFLRGSGVYGAAAATAKNMILKVIEESEKSRPDYTKVAIEATAISPPINSKLRKLVSAGKTFTYKQSKEKVFTEGFSLENPAFLAGGQVLSALTNLPADRVVLKADHLKTAIDPETELWQSIALSLGWSEWDLNMIQNQTKKPEIKYKISRSRTRPQRKTRTR